MTVHRKRHPRNYLSQPPAGSLVRVTSLSPVSVWTSTGKIEVQPGDFGVVLGDSLELSFLSQHKSDYTLVAINKEVGEIFTPSISRVEP